MPWFDLPPPPPNTPKRHATSAPTASMIMIATIATMPLLLLSEAMRVSLLIAGECSGHATPRSTRTLAAKPIRSRRRRAGRAHRGSGAPDGDVVAAREVAEVVAVHVHRAGGARQVALVAREQLA